MHHSSQQTSYGSSRVHHLAFIASHVQNLCGETEPCPLKPVKGCASPFCTRLHRAHTQVRPYTWLRGSRRGRPVCLPQVRRKILTYTSCQERACALLCMCDIVAFTHNLSLARMIGEKGHDPAQELGRQQWWSAPPISTSSWLEGRAGIRGSSPAVGSRAQ
jgi:hypothetical protein